jgi:hypothetical protein
MLNHRIERSCMLLLGASLMLAPGFYRCDLNAGGRIDPRHPDCCWTGR